MAVLWFFFLVCTKSYTQVFQEWLILGFPTWSSPSHTLKYSKNGWYCVFLLGLYQVIYSSIPRMAYLWFSYLVCTKSYTQVFQVWLICGFPTWSAPSHTLKYSKYGLYVVFLLGLHQVIHSSIPRMAYYGFSYLVCTKSYTQVFQVWLALGFPIWFAPSHALNWLKWNKRQLNKSYY